MPCKRRHATDSDSDLTAHDSDLRSQITANDSDDVSIQTNAIVRLTADVDVEPCLLTGITGEGVKRLHLVPLRGANHHTLSKLEYKLGLPWGSINVASLLNSVCLVEELYNAFDQGFLLLMPENRIMKLLEDDEQHTPITELLKDQTFNYTLMSAGNVGTICRHQTVEGKTVVEEYHHPFLNFPPIISNLHPVFAIWSAMAKLNFSRVHTYYDAYPCEFDYRKEAVALAFRCWAQWYLKEIPLTSKFYTEVPASPSRQDNLHTLLSYRADDKPFKHVLSHVLKGQLCLDEKTLSEFVEEDNYAEEDLETRVQRLRNIITLKWVRKVSRRHFDSGPPPLEPIVDDENTEETTSRDILNT